MKKILTSLFASASTLCLAQSAHGYETLAEHALIMDAETDVVLYAHDAMKPMIPASMTKIMTAYMVFDRLSDGRLSMDDTFRVSQRAWEEGGWASGGSTMGLAIGEEVKVSDLLRGMLVQSGNDACIVLAEGISGSEEAFAADMTTTAQELGLTTASFKNATGLLADGHEISAYDLARLADLTIEKFPDLYPIYAEPAFTWAGIRQPNRNPLLSRMTGADGLKTGHLDESGYGLVGTALIDNERRIVVINGMASERARAEESERILRAAFREFSIVEPFDSGDVIATLPVWLGKSDIVNATIDQDLAFGIQTSERNNIKAVVFIPETLRAPVEKGQKIGVLKVSGLGGGDQEIPLFAQDTVKKSGIFKRALSGLGQLLTPRGSQETSPETT